MGSIKKSFRKKHITMTTQITEILQLSSHVIYADASTGDRKVCIAHYELHPDGRFEPQCITDINENPIFDDMGSEFWNRVENNMRRAIK